MLVTKMLILAIDTSHKNGSVCLARADHRQFELIQTVQVDGGTFSAQLVPVISKLLKKHDLSKSDLQGIAAAVGPGSFTGLRIGLSAVKGLAEVLKIPIAAVSVLEAIAASATKRADAGQILAAMDAGRSEFYVGDYQLSGGELNRVSEFLCTREEFAAELRKRNPKPLVVTPEESAGAIAQAEHAPCELVEQPGSEVIARLGIRKLDIGQTVTADELDANYVRRDESLFSN